MATTRILVVEDDAKISEVIRLYLESSGYSVEEVRDGQTALERLTREPVFQLVVLDLMLPRVDGFEVCRRLRATSDVPVLLVTARGAEEDRLAGLDGGADDYLIKPFSPRELVARVRAILRRAPRTPASGPAVERAGVRLDPLRHEATVRGDVTALTPREFALLLALMRTPGRVFTRAELIERALGDEFEGLDRTIDVHVRNLRRKIEPDPAVPRLIETVPGVGYRFSSRDE
ncbi:MAG: response regulator transcription factor [Candidatus Eisenbacteria bacterium]|uniref:Response regulator transcription factor n=1 Tax=Eiseniibacteriota bacterium TaxID=2212470 RepID=A0A849SIZ2_UNCEI|nr:response regulator transcription factor [Candidatus Eisenbacteria bacterium]